MAHTIELPPDGELLVGVVADTHSRPHPELARWLGARRPDLILHGGDIGDLAVLRGLERVAPTLAVRGNIDASEEPEERVIELTADGRVELRVLLLHVAVHGPKLRAEVRRRAKALGARLVVCGHSHVPFIARDGDVTVFNPGSCGPRRFALPICFGWMTASRARLSLEHVDCETGRRWLPPGASQRREAGAEER